LTVNVMQRDIRASLEQAGLDATATTRERLLPQKSPNNLFCGRPFQAPWLILKELLKQYPANCGSRARAVSEA
jgi:hypothetical protein